MNKLVLVVDDDPHIREVVCFSLHKAGLRTLEAKDGQIALSQFDAHQPDVVVLDIMMPELDGTEVCRRLRAKSRVPIIFLSSKDDEIDRILGLELGGDDYITKPFSPRELSARVRAVLRRSELVSTATSETQTRQLRYGNLSLDLDRYRVYWGEQEVPLTVTEFGLVRTLLGYPGKVFTRDQLMNGAYSYDAVVNDRTIDSHIRRLRQKFAEVGGDPIATLHGVGYALHRN